MNSYSLCIINYVRCSSAVYGCCVFSASGFSDFVIFCIELNIFKTHKCLTFVCDYVLCVCLRII